MSTQYIQKFTDATKIPVDTASAAGVGIVGGALVVRDSSTPGSFGALALNSATDATTVKINSRTYSQATGDSLGAQLKPDQIVTTTGNIYGIQASPRVETGINANGIIGVSSQPIIKGTGSTIATDVRGYEAAIDLNIAGTPTVTGTVSALYAFLMAPTGGTYTGGTAVIHIPAADQKPWDYLVKVDVDSVGVIATSAGAAANKWFKVMVAGTVYKIALYATA